MFNLLRKVVYDESKRILQPCYLHEMIGVEEIVNQAKDLSKRKKIAYKYILLHATFHKWACSTTFHQVIK